MAAALPPDARDQIVDEIDEVYARQCVEESTATAQRWYWRETFSFSTRFLAERARERMRHGGSDPVFPRVNGRGLMRGAI